MNTHVCLKTKNFQISYMIESLFGGSSDGEKMPLWTKILIIVLFIIFVLPVIVFAIPVLALAIVALVHGESSSAKPIETNPAKIVKDTFSL